MIVIDSQREFAEMNGNVELLIEEYTIIGAKLLNLLKKIAGNEVALERFEETKEIAIELEQKVGHLLNANSITIKKKTEE